MSHISESTTGRNTPDTEAWDKTYYDLSIRAPAEEKDDDDNSHQSDIRATANLLTKETFLSEMAKIREKQDRDDERTRLMIAHFVERCDSFKDTLDRLGPAIKATGNSLATVFPPKSKLGAVPCPDKTFMLTDVGFEHALSLRDGHLKFAHLPSAYTNDQNRGCWLWRCVENNGWFGFRNVASGTYIGHDGEGGLHASAKHHKGWEGFCVRRDPHERGYILLMAVWEKLEKVRIVGSGEDAAWRLGTEGEPVVWAFVEIRD
ncbi:hypothetical protein QBC44DRAFT_335323 [Cladorrhinum sp. PSN332]|nr:hypothetical protein QBC44DRAFT_335323 [Cladorrhinum sp. PSN332]